MKLQRGSLRGCRHAPFSGRVAPSLPARAARPCVRANQNSGKIWGAEEENAAQVRRLINRDRKEFLGNAEGDILEKYKVELGGASTETSAKDGPTIGANTPNPFSSGAGASNPFGSAPAASPFGSAPSSSASPFKSSIEPTGLRPDMSPDPFVKETPVSFIKSITLTQVVLFCSFTLIILLMLATFNVVLNTGAIRLAGID
ncbi:hypothetical protein PLESTB_001176900 [Pleodorina starrii]|uniref:Uncharacterized protein n=1 Tax=Pleodorina starrii TaxID=330485 RepID=A0A9W6F624_9CHLO|nr:hypothetical protein PLESTM_000252800 [Pleodorina starrii]GLC57046.1 hypothetical protein PLESTB_001176900 [Pleodorina starrii]GLC64878.1 hypothetical protein PLESTF_000217000 [Pleodorina starrii]